jgi:hypothetical protein
MAEDTRSEEQLALAIQENAKWLRVSYSSLNTEESCQRKFEFNKLYPQRPRMFESFAADVGTSLHKGYQEYLISNDETKAFWAMTRSYPISDEWSQDNDFRSLEACTSTLEEMIESSALGEYELAQIKHPSGLVVPAIEVPFEIRLNGITLPDGRGIAFVGYMDAIMRNLLNGDFRTMDIKTHRRTTKDATAAYQYNAQQIPYGICIEHIQGNPVDSFEVLYYDCYVDLLNPRVTPYTFTKDRDDVQEWLMNTVLTAQRIQRNMEMNYFPRTSGGCLAFNKPCYFLEMCQSRDKEALTQFILGDQEPAVPRYEVPWIVAEIDVFGGTSE